MLKLVSWNIAHRKSAWKMLAACDVDIALLQEAGEPPADPVSRFDAGAEPWRTDGSGAGQALKWRTAIVRLHPNVALERIETARLHEASDGKLAVSRLGSIAAAHVDDPTTGERFTVVSLYALWERQFCAAGSGPIYADASVHRLISDVAALVVRENGHRVIAAGDLNVFYGHGDRGSRYWAERYRTIFDRLAAMGLAFVGPQAPNGRQADPHPPHIPPDSKNVPTFYTSRRRPATAEYQLDFVFASSDIASRVRATALNSVDQWGPSDHCRVQIEVGDRI